MSANDLAKLVKTIASDLQAELGTRKLVARVIRNHAEAIDALVAGGYAGETIIDEILKLTRSTAPSVTKSALRQSITRARKSLKQSKSAASSGQAVEKHSSALSKAESSDGVAADRSSKTHLGFNSTELQKKIQRRAQMARPQMPDHD